MPWSLRGGWRNNVFQHQQKMPTSISWTMYYPLALQSRFLLPGLSPGMFNGDIHKISEWNMTKTINNNTPPSTEYSVWKSKAKRNTRMSGLNLQSLFGRAKWCRLTAATFQVMNRIYSWQRKIYFTPLTNFGINIFVERNIARRHLATLHSIPIHDQEDVPENDQLSHRRYLSWFGIHKVFYTTDVLFLLFNSNWVFSFWD